ncbi:MAG: sensor histidine kinase [Burkholderiales bacterium]|nr:sensor histidine kinase [Burkholderiales bacterium]MDE2567236.1 sensor histidine kinase [Burkholderiales bacterium]
MAPTEAAPARPLPSLRRRVLWRVMGPLALTWLLGSALTVTVATVYTRKAFDRSLLDDAYAVATNVELRGDRLAFALTGHQAAQVLFDHGETVLFAVAGADGSLIAGQPGLRPDATGRGEPWVFGDRDFEHLALRTVTLRRLAPRPFTVVVAQTTRSRSRLVGQLLLASVVPQAGLLLALGLWLRRSIRRELEPLASLEQALEQRDTNDLAPVQLTPRTRDIAHLADAVNALMARIDAGVQVQREFAGNVAHELRTPLAGIRSLAEYGLAQRDPSVWQQQLRRIVASEARASHLVDQLLALALADEAGASLQLGPVALDALVRELLLRTLPSADARGVDLGAAGLEQPLYALGSPALLEGLLSNLLDNAFRYGRPAQAGETPRVTVTAEAQGAEVCLSVTDNGPGMDAEQCERVLARWEQGAAALQQRGGTGLGLAIAVRYVALLGGRMALGAAPEGPGLRASVWLLRPAMQAPQAPPSAG